MDRPSFLMRVNLLLIEKPHNHCLRLNEVHKIGLKKKKKRKNVLKAKNFTHNS